MLIAAIFRIGRRRAKYGTKFVSKWDPKNHSANVCRSKLGRTGENTTKDVDEFTTVFHYMCNNIVACTSSSDETGRRAVNLDHHTLKNKNPWITKQSPPELRVYLTARAHTKDNVELRYPLYTRTRQITIFMTTDTGCQLVLVGIKFIHRLKTLDLITVKTKLLAVNAWDSYPTTVRKIGVWQTRRDRTSLLGDRQDTWCILESGSLFSTSRASDQPLSNPCPLAQLHQAHAMRSETASAPYASRRHHH